MIDDNRLPDALLEAGGFVISELRREWKREMEVVQAQSRQCAAEAQEIISGMRAEIAILRCAVDERVSDRLELVKDGAQGERGPQGEPGLKGDIGFSGPQGERGETGQAGERGLPGPMGEIGPQGEQGPMGGTGQAGEIGPQGERGLPGPIGSIGPQGPPGEAGGRGERGEAGLIGPAGERGLQGHEGQRGPVGECGPKGPPGMLPLVRVWTDGQVFYQGDVVVHGGGTYQALKDTGREPVHVADWACLAKAGENGRDGRGWTICGTYDAGQTYSVMDVVTLNSTWFVARTDNPGACPGPGWQSGPTGKAGRPGPQGERGQKGEKGEPGETIIDWRVDRAAYLMVPVMSDGSDGAPLSLRALFEQFDDEKRRA